MLMFLTLGISGFAQNTLTVADGTTTNSYVPVYGFYVDDYVRSQTIYPSSMLTGTTDLTGETILGVTYYLSSPADDSWGDASFVVKVKEVTDATLTAFVDMTNATTVYSGSLDGTQSTMAISFTTPYTYQGGNLLIEVSSTATGDYSSVSYYGVAVTGASWQGYSSTSASAVTGSVRDFIPKTTFLYGSAPTCFKVTNLAVDATQTTTSSVTLTWTDALNTGATYNIYDMSDTSLIQSGVSGLTYTATGLTPSTVYTFGVETDCGGGDIAPGYATVNCHTACVAVTLPYTETFASTSGTRECWELVATGNIGGSYGMGFITEDGREVLRFSSYSSASDYNQYGFSPLMDVSSTATTLNVAVVYATRANDYLYFGYVTPTDTIWDPTAYNTNSSSSAINWETASFVIPANATQLAVHYYGNYAYYAWIDSVVVTEMTGDYCFPVNTLAASDVTAYGATLNWVGQANSYNIYNMADSSLVTTTSDTNVVINTLNPNTPYTLGVQADCGSVQSDIVTVSFTTLVTCPAPTGLAVTLTPGDGTVASLSWTEVGTAQDWQICLNGDTNNLIDVTTNPYGLTGLTPEQAYTAQVRAYCDVNDQSAWSNLVNFTPTNAYTITVNDGTTTNSIVPIYGLWTDDITKSQFIIPASALSAMQFGNINKLTFHASNSNVSWGAAQFNVYVTETNETTVSALADYSTMTQVYAGTLSISNNMMEVTFTNPYLYMGGNLMIGFLQTLEGTYSSCSWYGVSATGASQGGYGTSISQRNFLPKTTIAYTPGTQPSCLPVTNLTVDSVTGTSVFLSWTDNNNSGATYTIYDMADTSVVASGISTTDYEVAGLTGSTSYTFAVVANCSATEESNPISVNATTDCTAGSCQISIEGADSFGDGWNGASITVMQSGVTLGTFTIVSGSASTENYNVCSDAPVTFSWTAGSYPGETSFEILAGGAPVYTVSDGSTLSAGVFFTLNNACPSCLPATALTVDTATDNSVTISWTGTAPSYDLYIGSTYETTVSTTTYTFTGLSAATNYTFGVQAICSATDSAILMTVSASTDCGVITTYPYSQDFSAAPACWMILDADGDGYNWSLYQGTIQSASYVSSALTPDNWLITPQFAIPATGSYEVTWTATAQDQSWPAEHYGVFVSTTVNNDTAAYTMLQEWTLGPGIFNPVIDLSAYAGQNIYIALRHFNCTDQFRLSIDEFIVREQAGANQVTINVGPNNPAYGTVTGAGIYNIGDNVTVGATANSGYTFSKWVDDNNTLISNANPYTFVAATDLNLTAIFLNDAGTTYTITVNVNDSTMGTATGGGTYTAGDQITLTATPFSGYNFVNWTQVSGFGTNVVGTDTTLIITVTGDKTFVANFEAGSGPVVTPPTVTTAAATSIGQTNATLNGTITPGSETITVQGFEWKETAGGTYTQVNATGTTISYDLTGLTPNTGYTFRAFATTASGTTYGDEMTFTTLDQGQETCAAPTNVIASNITNNSADISWTQQGDVTSWDVNYRVAGSTSWNTNTTTTNPYTLTGLSDNTTYEVQVIAHCSNGVTSDPSATITLTTVGINDYELNNVVVYPNPTTGMIQIQNSESRIQNVEVYDAYGKLLNVVNVNDNTAALDLSGYAAGTYFVKIVTENGVVTKRVVKQ